MTESRRDFGRELYPFLHPTSVAVGGEVAALLLAVRQSTLAKCSEVVAMRNALLGEFEDEMIAAASAMAERFAAGATLLACGNGGSATDADDAVADCLAPPVAGWRALPAVSLVAEGATVTAVTNDVGFEHAFTRQLAALARPGDIALGFTTSGSSANVVAAMELARRRG
ncbi:MAG: SIS domain-containing protein, partial [Geodermatophilaceae bacterium]|nr:SIS domain-containing protein [Geodermatophilaceae bacterium]